MARSLRASAEEYEPTKVKNISEMERISVDEEIEAKTFAEGGEKEFTVDVISRGDENYRVPVSVLAQLKAHMEKKPFEFFSVLRTGTTISDTKYTVVPEY